MNACFIAHVRVKVGAVLELATDGPGSSLNQTALPHWCLEAGVWKKNSVAVVTASVLLMSERGPTVERTSPLPPMSALWMQSVNSISILSLTVPWPHKEMVLVFFFYVILLFSIFSFTYCIVFWFEKGKMFLGQIKNIYNQCFSIWIVCLETDKWCRGCYFSDFV